MKLWDYYIKLAELENLSGGRTLNLDAYFLNFQKTCPFFFSEAGEVCLAKS